MLDDPNTLFAQYGRLQLQVISRLSSVFIVVYLASLVMLALFRMFSGVSIKRFGYLAICSISFHTKHGHRIQIGRIGLHVHRPTVARPGWFEIVVKNCEIKLSDQKAQSASPEKPKKESSSFGALFEQELKSIPLLPESQKGLRRFVKWLIPALKVINVSFNSLLIQTQAANYVVGSISVRLDLRNLRALRNSNFVGTLDAYKLKPTEIRALLELHVSEFFVAESLDDEEPHPILDNFRFYTSGVLDKKSLELKELDFSVYVHNMHLHLERMMQVLKHDKKKSSSGTLSRSRRLQLAKIGVAIVYLVKEIDIKLNSLDVVGIPTAHTVKDQEGENISCILSVTDVALNIRRMNPSSPGFKLLYPDSPAAHQAFLKVSSVNFGVDANNVQEELLYVPLVSLLFQTDAAAKTLNYIQDEQAETNDSVINGSININSPTVNIETHHLPILLEMLNKKGSAPSGSSSSKRTLNIPTEIQNALPKLDLNMHVSDAALRVVFDGGDNRNSMFITSSSRIHSQLLGTHSKTEDRAVYNLEQEFEIIKGAVWYTSDDCPRFVISSSEQIGLKMNIVTQPDVTVDVSVTLSNINHDLARYEIFHAIRCLVLAIRPSLLHKKPPASESRALSASKSTSEGSPEKPSPLRKLPSWLRKFDFDARSLTFTLASEKFRGQTSDLAGVKCELSHVNLRYDKGKGRGPVTEGREVHVEIEDLKLQSLNTVHVVKPKPQNKTLTSGAWISLPSVKVSVCTAKIETEDEGELDVRHTEVFFKVPEVKLVYNMNVFLSLFVVREVLDYSYGRDLLVPDEPHAKPRKEKISVKANIDYANLKAHLPNNENMMITICDGVVEHFPHAGLPKFECSGIKMYSLHPFNARAWCVILSLVRPRVQFRIKADAKDDQLVVDVEGLRVNVPFQFKLYRIIDNTITFIKAMTTLRKQTLQRDPLLILEPKVAPISPKIPRVCVNAKTVALTLEDDPFESELNLIFLVQKHELEARIHKDILFEKEIKNVLRSEGFKIIEQYAQKIADDILHSEASSRTLTEEGEQPEPHKHRHTFSDQLMCRNCKHKQNGAKKSKSFGSKTVSHTRCLFCRPTKYFERYTHSANSTLHSSEKSHDANSIAKDLRQRIELLLSSPMDLLAVEAASAKASKGWSELWTAPEMYPWRQLKITVASLKETGLLQGADELADFGERTSITIIEARRRLLKHHTESWVRSIDDARASQMAGVKKTHETQFPDSFDPKTTSEELVVGYSDKPLLFNARFNDLSWRIRKPDMNEDELRQFLFDYGKGLPKDQKFSIFAPLYFDVDCHGGFDLNLRDYPLPVLSFPKLSAMQDPRGGSALQIKGNFIIAEQYPPGKEQVRPLFVPLFPDTPNRMYSSEKEPSWAVVEVHRTLAAVKMFSDLKFVTNSDLPTRFCWCSAYKPAFQSMQNGFAQFSKPPIDQSAVMGFWDKIRLTFHARLRFELKKSSLFFLLKGLRSPYVLHRGGAGFAFAWEKNVTVDINPDDDPTRLFVVKSEVFKTLIPDFTAWEQDYMSRLPGERAYPLRTDLKAMGANTNSKVVMKFSNSTEWVAGMSFAKNSEKKDGEKQDIKCARDKDFRPHYDVQLTMPEYVKDPDNYDAYHGFRSDYVFMAVSVRSLECMGEPGGWNAVHLSPLVLRHFATWKDQFNNTLWPPTRSGKLFPGETHKKTKLGSVLSGHQYQLALEPLYISFMARHVSHRRSNQILAGLKARVDRFVLDLHLRKEPIGNHKRWATKLFEGQVAAEHTEIRVLAATIQDSTVRDARYMHSESDSDSIYSHHDSSTTSGNKSTSQSSSFAQASGERATHNDWIDFDDFTDVMSDIHHGKKPKVHIEPFAYTSHLCYRKKTDHSKSDVGEVDGTKYLKFGREVVHDCLIDNDSPWEHHINILEARKKQLLDVIEDHKATIESVESDLRTYPQNEPLLEKMAELQEGMKVYQASLTVVESSIRTTQQCDGLNAPEKLKRDDQAKILQPDKNDIYFNEVTVQSLNVKWNNEVRDLVFRLKVLYSGYKEMAYARSRRALRYLEELVEELESRADETQAERDVRRSQETDPCEPCEAAKKCHSEVSAGEDIRNFKENMVMSRSNESAQNTMLVRLITPQIQVLSNKNPDKCVLVASSTIDVRNVNIYDHFDADTDFDSAQVESRFGVILHQSNVFVFSKENMSRSILSNLCYSGYSIEEPAGSAVPYPPWLGIEFCTEAGVLKRFLLAPKLEVAVRYIRMNDQHVLSDQSDGEATTDGASDAGEDMAKHELSGQRNKRSSRLLIDCPKLSVQCDSIQYYTAYTIFKDLIHYTDPITEDADNAVERVALAIDIASDYRYSLNQLSTLQSNLMMMNLLFDNITARRYNRREETDRDLVKLEMDFRRASLDLMVTMRAFKSALRKSNKTDTSDIFYSNLRFDEALVTALNDRGVPFMELSVVNAGLRALKKGEQYAHYSVSIGLLQAWNLMQSSVYPDIISPHGRFNAHQSLIRFECVTTDAVGGIPIIEDVQVKMLPIKFQLEHSLYHTMRHFALPDEDITEVEKESQAAGIIGGRLHVNEDSDDSDDSGSEMEEQPKETKRHALKFGIAKKVGKLMTRQRHSAEITELVNRAANFMNINQFVIHETGVVVSYKGQGATNILDVQDVEIEIPEIKYINKLWCKEDLFSRLKKDLIKIVLHNSGQILGNKFIKHHKVKQKVHNQVLHNNTLERMGSHTSEFSELSGSFSRAEPLVNSRHNSAAGTIAPIEWTDDHKSASTSAAASTAASTKASATASATASTRASLDKGSSIGGSANGPSARPSLDSKRSSTLLKNTSKFLNTTNSKASSFMDRFKR